MTSKQLLTKDGEEYFVSEQPKLYFGNNKVFWFSKGEPLITLGPQFEIFMMCFLVFELLGFVVYYFCASDQYPRFKIFYKVLIALEGITYLWTALKNPGIITGKDFDDPEPKEDPKFKIFCDKCSVLRVKDIWHCKDCDVCIRKYEHHCKLTGKCIGDGNLYAFYAFLIVSFFYLMASLALIAIKIDLPEWLF